jgi:hypothetical protein
MLLTAHCRSGKSDAQSESASKAVLDSDRVPIDRSSTVNSDRFEVFHKH